MLSRLQTEFYLPLMAPGRSWKRIGAAQSWRHPEPSSDEQVLRASAEAQRLISLSRNLVADTVSYLLLLCRILSW